MTINKYLCLFILSIALTATSRHFYIEQHRREMRSDSITHGMKLIHQKAGAYLEQEGENSGLASATVHEHHENQECDKHSTVHGNECKHGHTHVTGFPLADPEVALKKPFSEAHEDETEHHHEEHEHHAGHDHHDKPAAHGDHEHDHEHDHHAHQKHATPDPAVSPGLVMLLRQLGFAELAANLLWIQMDADSHRGLWHRVEIALEIIPALDPTFIDAYLLRSFLLDEYQKRHDEALQILENAVKQIPNRIELWQQIGLFCMNHSRRHGPVRRLPQALDAFQKMYAFPDAPPPAARLVAVTLAAMERRNEAIAFLQQVASDTERPDDQKQIDRTMINRIREGEKF